MWAKKQYKDKKNVISFPCVQLLDWQQEEEESW